MALQNHSIDELHPIESLTPEPTGCDENTNEVDFPSIQTMRQQVCLHSAKVGKVRCLGQAVEYMGSFKGRDTRQRTRERVDELNC